MPPIFTAEFLAQFGLESSQDGATIYNYDRQYFQPPTIEDDARVAACEAHCREINLKFDEFANFQGDAEQIKAKAEELVVYLSETFKAQFVKKEEAEQYIKSLQVADDNYFVKSYLENKSSLCDLCKTIISSAFYLTHEQDGQKRTENECNEALETIKHCIDTTCVGGNITTLNETVFRYRFPHNLYQAIKDHLVKKNDANVYAGNQVHITSLFDHFSENIHGDSNYTAAAADMTFANYAKLLHGFNLYGFETMVDFFSDKYSQFASKIAQQEDFSGKMAEMAGEFGIEMPLFPYLADDDEVAKINSDENYRKEKIRQYFIEQQNKAIPLEIDEELAAKLQVMSMMKVYVKRNQIIPIWLLDKLLNIYLEEYRNTNPQPEPQAIIEKLFEDIKSKGVTNVVTIEDAEKYASSFTEYDPDNLQDCFDVGESLENIEAVIATQELKSTQQPQYYPQWHQPVERDGVQTINYIPMNVRGLLFHPEQNEILHLLKRHNIPIDNQSIKAALVQGDENFITENLLPIVSLIGNAHRSNETFLPAIYLDQMNVIRNALTNSGHIASAVLQAQFFTAKIRIQEDKLPLLAHMFFNSSGQEEVLKWAEQCSERQEFFKLIISNILIYKKEDISKYYRAITTFIRTDEDRKLLLDLATNQQDEEHNIITNLFSILDGNNNIQPQTLLEIINLFATKKHHNKIMHYCNLFVEKFGAHEQINEVKFKIAASKEVLLLLYGHSEDQYDQEKKAVLDSYQDLARLGDDDFVGRKSKLAFFRLQENSAKEKSEFHEIAAIVARVSKNYQKLLESPDPQTKNTAKFKLAFFREKGFGDFQPNAREAFAMYAEFEQEVRGIIEQTDQELQAQGIENRRERVKQYRTKVIPQVENFDAIARLITCYLEGIGTNIDERKAFELCEKYARYSSKIAAIYLNCHAYGIGTAQNIDMFHRSYNAFKEIFHDGNVTYQYLKIAKEQNIALEASELSRLKLEARQQGNIDANLLHVQDILRDQRSSQEDKIAATAILHNLAKENHVESIIFLARLYEGKAHEERVDLGLLINVDREKANDLYKKAAVLGSEYAMLNVAEYYKFTKQDDKNALPYYNYFLNYIEQNIKKSQSEEYRDRIVNVKLLKGRIEARLSQKQDSPPKKPKKAVAQRLEGEEQEMEIDSD